MFARQPLGLAIAALFALPASAADFTNTYFFGDSLTDSGYFKPILKASGAGALVDAGFAGKFTTNPGPVWSEALAAKLGTSAAPSNTAGGTNYAQGGARVNATPGFGGGPATTATPITGQVGAYLTANGGAADSHALYTVWGGANDLFYAAGGGVPVASLPTFVLTTVTQQVGAVEALKNAGAKYIIVPSLPNMGKTPAALAAGATAAAGLTQLSSSYNTQLFGQMAAKGLNVIPLDTFNLITEVQANAAAFGFTNSGTATACVATATNPTATSLLCGAPGSTVANPQEYVFADGVHPTTHTHAILADYAYSMLMAPQQIGMLAETPVRTRNTLTNTLLDQGMESPTKPSRLWVSANGGQLKYADSPEFGGADGLPWGITVGYDTRTNLGGLGIAFNGSSYKPDFAADGGSYSQTELSASLYGGMVFGQLGVSFAGTIGYINYNTDRDVHLGNVTRTMSGETEGSNVSAGMQAFYQLQSGKLTHGPVAGLTAQRVQVRAFTESNASGASTALSFGSQVRQSVLGRLGYQLSYDATSFIPYGRIGVEHDFIKSTDRDIEVGLPSLYSGSYKLPAGEVDQTAATVQLGSRFHLSPALGAWVEFNGNFGRKDVTDYGFSGGLRYAF